MKKKKYIYLYTLNDNERIHTLSKVRKYGEQADRTIL